VKYSFFGLYRFLVSLLAILHEIVKSVVAVVVKLTINGRRFYDDFGPNCLLVQNPDESIT